MSYAADTDAAEQCAQGEEHGRGAKQSKCREAFEKQYGEDFNPDHSPVASVWQAAWDARGKVDVEICKEQSIRFAEAMNRKATYGAVKCEIAIKQEQCMK